MDLTLEVKEGIEKLLVEYSKNTGFKISDIDIRSVIINLDKKVIDYKIKLVFMGFEASGYYSDAHEVIGIICKKEDEGLIKEAMIEGYCFCGLDGKHSEVEGDPVYSDDIEEILDIIFSQDYQNYPEEMIKYHWQEGNEEKFNELIKLNQDISEKCGIKVVTEYIIPDEFK